MLYGAIIGDIAGSRFEFHNIRGADKKFELLHPACFFTDDTVMTCAIAKAIMDCNHDYVDLDDMAVKNMQEVGRRYPDCGYGRRFYNWMFSDDPHPYGSCGNGSAMRVSAVGYAAEELADALVMAKEVTDVTHNHPEGIKAAEATAACIWLARHDFTKDEIKDYVQRYFYPLNFTLDEIRDGYKHTELALYTVPQAIEAFLESTDYESAIRLAITLGGDSDTIAAIAGGIAGAFYGVPDDLRLIASTYLTPDLLKIVNDFDAYILGKEDTTP